MNDFSETNEWTTFSSEKSAVKILLFYEFHSFEAEHIKWKEHDVELPDMSE